MCVCGGGGGGGGARGEQQGWKSVSGEGYGWVRGKGGRGGEG